VSTFSSSLLFNVLCQLCVKERNDRLHQCHSKYKPHQHSLETGKKSKFMSSTLDLENLNLQEYRPAIYALTRTQSDLGTH
jgi:hypothetical protein